MVERIQTIISNFLKFEQELFDLAKSHMEGIGYSFKELPNGSYQRINTEDPDDVFEETFDIAGAISEASSALANAWDQELDDPKEDTTWLVEFWTKEEVYNQIMEGVK